MKVNLKTVNAPETLPALLKELLRLRAEVRDMSRLPRLKVSAKTAMAMVCEAASAAPEEVEKLSDRLRTLEPTQEYEAALWLVNDVYDRAIKLPGDLVPPRSNVCPKPAYMDALGCCLNLHVSPLELVAVAWYRAVTDHPEIFAEGCDDPTAHEHGIQDKQKLIEEIAIKASHAWTADDLDFQFVGNGHATVTYRISKGAVAATAPDDPRGLGWLTDWFEKNPDEAEKL